MELHLFRSMWGVDAPWTTVLPRLPDLGFLGIEAPLPFLQDHPPDLAARHGLGCLPMIFTEGATVAEHVASFREQLEACRAYDPVLVTCHDGRDAWTEDEAARYFREVLAIEDDLGVPVAHETHRGRILFTPWRTVGLLDRFEPLRLCCDFSHWVCVCERLLDDQEDALAYCAERTLHVHARVGFEEGPQVPDPRAPEYRPHLDAHERWWSLIWQAQHARDHSGSTMTPEFGPPPYLHTLPHTAMPVADLDAICTWMAQRQADRFAQSFS